MSTENELPDNIADLPEIHPASAQESAEKPKKVIGRPITKETAKQYQLSAARAKRLRKEARAKMLSALTESLDLGQELLKAMTKQDDRYLGMIERATRLVGLQHDQSPEAVAQKLEVKSDSKVKMDNNLHFIIEEAKPEPETDEA